VIGSVGQLCAVAIMTITVSRFAVKATMAIANGRGEGMRISTTSALSRMVMQ
jgi:hypothetical protein